MARAMSTPTESQPCATGIVTADFHSAAERLLDLSAALEHRHFNLPLVYHFRWQGLNFKALISDHQTEKGNLVEISSTIGKLPFTAEDDIIRVHMQDFIARHTTPLTGQFMIGRHGVVTFVQKTAIPNITSTGSTIRSLALCLLQAQPYLKAFQGLISAPDRSAG